jgi:aspartate aminotransferase
MEGVFAMKDAIVSATVAINQEVLAKKQAGEKVYNLAAGDPAIAVHPCILQACLHKIAKGESSYPPVEGIGELRTACAHWLNTSYSTDFSAKEVVVTCGAKFALFATMQALLQEGDEVLIVAPYWVSYPSIALMHRAVPKILHTTANTGWKITGEQILHHATGKTKLLIINNPCNPTGALYTRDELEVILMAAKKANILVVADEVYSGLVYDGAFVSCGSFAQYRDQVVVIQSCSKNFAMPGWRVGFLVAPDAIVKRVIPVLGQSITGTATCSQWAALGALENSGLVTEYVREAMRKRRDLFMRFIKKIEPPKAALYAFVPVEEDSSSLCMRLLREENIAAVPGIAFGKEGYVRFAFSTSEEELRLGLQRLTEGGWI